MGSGRLYVVATPIGNLGDLTPRAVEVLGEVDVVACEDTRVTRRLLTHAGLRTSTLSYRDENAARVAPRLIVRLGAGESVALACDAGTPCLSDPGYRLVRGAAAAGIEVVAVPGPSALTAMMAVCGLPTDRVLFEGFLPARGAKRRAAIERARQAGCTTFIYESPRRVVGLLRELAELCDDPEVAVGRELTKMHEEVLRGSASRVADEIEASGARGEFVVAAAMEAVTGKALEGGELDDAVERLLAEGSTAREAAGVLKAQGVSRRAVYEAVRRLRDGDE